MVNRCAAFSVNQMYHGIGFLSLIFLAVVGLGAKESKAMQIEAATAPIHANHSSHSNRSNTSSSIVSPVPLRAVEALRKVQGSISVKSVDGKTVLSFSEDFSVSRPRGYMWYVMLLRPSNPAKAFLGSHHSIPPYSYVVVSELAKDRGAQSYPLPARVDIKDAGSIAIVCYCENSNSLVAYVPIK
jgi:hypothetical protein